MTTEQIIAIAVTQVVTVLGALLAGWLGLSHQRKLARTQLAVRHVAKRTEAQLSQLYGPLMMMLQTNKALFDKTIGTDVWDQTRLNVLLPNNAKIARLLLSKSHLFEGGGIPESYVAFLQHSLIWQAYKDHPAGLPLEYLEKNATFPHAFEAEVVEQFQRVSKAYAGLAQP